MGRADAVAPAARSPLPHSSPPVPLRLPRDGAADARRSAPAVALVVKRIASELCRSKLMRREK